MAQLLTTLQDPQLVAQFQRYCGLSLQPKGEANGTSLGNYPLETNQRGRGKTTGGNGITQQNGNTNHSNGSYANGALKQVNTKKYRVQNYFLYYLFRFAAALGQEVFYITFLPFTYWNLDPFIGHRLVVVWAIVMYFGQASKDLLKWPRPSSPPVVKLETRVDAEYGMPSTHAIAATAISFTPLGRYQYLFWLGFLAALFLSTLVSLSRLYTGMHTVLDVICGALIALLFLALTYPVWGEMDKVLLSHPLSPVFTIIVGFLASYNYPEMDHYSTTRADTTTIIGVAVGTCVGVSIGNLDLNSVPSDQFPLPIPAISFHRVLLQTERFLLGIILLLITRFLAKTLSLQTLGTWHNVCTKDHLVRQRLEIEVPYKFVTYTSIGFVATAVVPQLCEFLGI
ncbi:LOW QUALITY PROTEIN: sphingosine-1-phosphate phosphatase 2 [Xenopus laevis]|uniref:LOW QUALITY PROTEIN: sphingosine-1-phosphate phosphatase 2 n=1 Tax=Xenopus laevis TaxID=8355 RepID=A0A8J1KUA9_XENLA|nr:LOW QUALITY PROTEIN: sphingosine-1-phosphate phosphatase 2 [Xenopus laevis]